MSIKDQIYLVIIAILAIIILFLKRCAEPEKPRIVTKTIVKTDTVDRYKTIKDSIPYPVPVYTEVLTPATETCPEIVLNTYKFPLVDSLGTGVTTVRAKGEVIDFVRDFKIRERTVNNIIIQEKTIYPKLKNQYFLGVDLGGKLSNKEMSTPSLGVNMLFVGKKGVTLSLRRDLIQETTTFGAYINLRKNDKRFTN